MGVADDLGLAAEDGAVLAAARTRYGEPHRRYHDWSHVRALARGFADHRALFTDGRAAALAILHHDAVYEGRPGEDEAASADLLVRERTGREAPGTLALAEAMVRATAGHAVPDGLRGADAADCAGFLDLDLGILAAPPGAYDRYAAGVRAEYAHVPDAAWRAGRARVLSGFLARERLYLTGRFHAAWDGAARANLRRELAGLQDTSGD